ncbi:hypothetical protein ACHAW5_000381 [Stephanodiscus triporus]|uniref:Uncharacterized protein n=1 Tax=Stephanodiscus triporus TaxID=2934178 RepID=A0ABD3N4G6_9STRA
MVRTPAGRSEEERSSPTNAPQHAAYSSRRQSSSSAPLGRRRNEPRARLVGKAGTVGIPAAAAAAAAAAPAGAKVDVVVARAAGESAGASIATAQRATEIASRTADARSSSTSSTTLTTTFDRVRRPPDAIPDVLGRAPPPRAGGMTTAEDDDDRAPRPVDANPSVVVVLPPESATSVNASDTVDRTMIRPTLFPPHFVKTEANVVKLLNCAGARGFANENGVPIRRGVANGELLRALLECLAGDESENYFFRF